jgi:hypothetical protein
VNGDQVVASGDLYLNVRDMSGIYLNLLIPVWFRLKCAFCETGMRCRRGIV